MNILVDVLIIGAGIPALVIANKLAAAGLTVNLLEQAAKHQIVTINNPAPRVSALTLSSQAVVKQLTSEVTSNIKHIAAIKKIVVWDSLSKAKITFCAPNNDQDALAYIVENEQLTQALLHSLKNFSNVEVHCPVTPETVLIAANTVQLTTTAGQGYAAKLIIGADGAHSWLREQLGVQLYQRDYHQSAIVATIGMERPHNNTAYQCFLPSGPLAFLPLAEPQQCSIVWSTTAAESLLNLDEAEFIAVLEQKLENKLGKLTLLSARAMFALQMRHVKEYVRERAAFIGDAAHTLHPLAGQGLNLGIADAVCLADVIIAAYKKRRQFFSLHELKKYQRVRKLSNWNTILAMEGFHQLFTQQNSLLVKIRGAGLTFVDQMSLLKRYFINLAQ